MQNSIELDDLRELFLSAPGSSATRVVAIGLSTALLVFVAWLVRRRKLAEEYTPIWVTIAVVITLISVRIDLLRAMTRALGAWTASSTIFFLGEVFLMAICLNYAVRLSRNSKQLKNLAQEAAILRARVDELSSAARASDSAQQTTDQ